MNHSQSRESRSILCFAREAGGAEAIAPVVATLQGKHPVILLAKDYAKDVFARHRLPFREIPGYAPDLIEDIEREYGIPHLVFTSATSLPWNDMTERYLWKWAEARGIPSIAVMDQWQNYSLRFSGPTPEERLKYLPTWICVMDEYARLQMEAEGIPPSHIAVTGQPAFDALLHYAKAFPPSKITAIRRSLGVTGGETLVMFVSEALARDFGDSLGYTEDSTLATLLEVLSRLASRGYSFCLVVKLHPQNQREDFSDIDLDGYGNPKVRLVEKEFSPRDLVLASDLVVGMASTLLVESILLGKPTLSVQIGCTRDDCLIATKMGTIPLIKSAEELEGVCLSLLTDVEYRKRYLTRQERLRTDGLATDRIVVLIEHLVNGIRKQVVRGGPLA